MALITVVVAGEKQIAINPDYVIKVHDNGPGKCAIHMAPDEHVHVREDYSDLVRRLNSAMNSRG